MTSPPSSSNRLAHLAPGSWSASLPGGAELVCLGKQAGDFSAPGSARAVDVQGELTVQPWTWLHQVHGGDVVVVDRPGACRGADADAAISAVPGVVLAVMTADCAPVGLASPEGVAGIVHAGWRGLLADVVEASVAAMRRLGASEISAALGPCIRPHAYSFSGLDLAAVAERFGPSVRGLDSCGQPALDLPAAVAAALSDAGATLVCDCGTCTHCSSQHWSWRQARDSGRQANLLLTGVAQA